jgi:hypothetical protein
MKFHAHLTVSSIDKVPKGWKETTIMLENKQIQQTDVMLTKHYKLGRKNIVVVDDIKRDIQRLDLSNLLRVKIEQDDGFYLPVSKENYVEIHALCNCQIEPPKGWVKSKNPRKQLDGNKFYFLNKRVFFGSDVNSIQQHAIAELAGIDVLEFKVEQIVYDSNFNHDSWWAS